MRPCGYESTSLCHVWFDMNLFILLYKFDSIFIIIDEPIWQVLRGNIGNNECYKNNM